MNHFKMIWFLKRSLIFILFGLLASSASIAQTPDVEQSWKSADQWRKEGQFLSIQLSRGNPLRIFVVGKEEAKLDISTLNLTVRRLKPYPGKVLNVNKFDHYFEIADSSELKQAKEIEIMANVKDKSETFHFKLKKENP